MVQARAKRVFENSSISQPVKNMMKKAEYPHNQLTPPFWQIFN
jgi:hypothetical protein